MSLLHTLLHVTTRDDEYSMYMAIDEHPDLCATGPHRHADATQPQSTTRGHGPSPTSTPHEIKKHKRPKKQLYQQATVVRASGSNTSSYTTCIHSVTCWCSWSFKQSSSQQHVNTNKDITTFAESGSGHSSAQASCVGSAPCKQAGVLKVLTTTGSAASQPLISASNSQRGRVKSSFMRAASCGQRAQQWHQRREQSRRLRRWVQRPRWCRVRARWWRRLRCGPVCLGR